MIIMSSGKHFTFYILCILLSHNLKSSAQQEKIWHDPKAKQVVFGNKKITLTFNYNKAANISQLKINGLQVLQEINGIYSAIRTKNNMYSTLHLASDPVIRIFANKVI